jgi:hypothetical protein
MQDLFAASVTVGRWVAGSGLISLAHRLLAIVLDTPDATAIWLFRSCITIYNCSQLARTRIYSHY